MAQSQMYFASHPKAAHDPHLIKYRVGQIELQFKTDAGVFAKQRVDYGTGVLLHVLPNIDFPMKKILDVGTGYGPLGLFAAKFWPSQTVTMVDVNQRALALAKRNARLNGITNVNIFRSDLYEALKAKSSFGLIVTNPPIRAGKKVVFGILKEAATYLVPKGKLLLVIRKKQGEPSARKLLKKVYHNCTILKRDKGYYILLAVKNN